jgi:hypothetical protein
MTDRVQRQESDHEDRKTVVFKVGVHLAVRRIIVKHRIIDELLQLQKLLVPGCRVL